MRKKTTVKWIADDGTIFDDKKSCEIYELRKTCHHYRVTTQIILENTETIWATDEQAAIEKARTIAPYIDEWEQISEDSKITILE